MTGATCDGCGRSVWSCDQELGPDCRAYREEMTACSSASHERAKRSNSSHLHYAGIQEDWDGTPLLVLLRCTKCESTLAVSPADWLASARHAPSGPRLHIVTNHEDGSSAL